MVSVSKQVVTHIDLDFILNGHLCHPVMQTSRITTSQTVEKKINELS
jgi:hypothetical protein